jgi:hypothetical protein
MPHDQPIRPRDVDPAGERLLDGGEIPEKDESHDDGQERQQRAQLLALQIAPDKKEVAHGTTGGTGVGLRSPVPG